MVGCGKNRDDVIPFVNCVCLCFMEGGITFWAAIGGGAEVCEVSDWFGLLLSGDQ